MTRRRGSDPNNEWEQWLQRTLSEFGWTETESAKGVTWRTYVRGSQRVQFHVLTTEAQLKTAHKLLSTLDARMTGCDILARNNALLPPRAAAASFFDPAIEKWRGAHARKKEGHEGPQG